LRFITGTYSEFLWFGETTSQFVEKERSVSFQSTRKWC